MSGTWGLQSPDPSSGTVFLCRGQVTSSLEEGIHQLPHGPAELAMGCKIILIQREERPAGGASQQC